MPDTEITLHWITSSSADTDNHDQETTLEAIGAGMPGSAVRASVSPNSDPGYGPWVWVIYDRWLDVDEEPDPTGTLLLGQLRDSLGIGEPE